MMRVCISLQGAGSMPTLEESIFEFTQRLSGVCDSIDTCNVTAGVPSLGAGGRHTESIRVELRVFGEALEAVGTGSACSSNEALTRALEDAFGKLTVLLTAVANEHRGCACRATRSSRDDESCCQLT